MAIVQQWFTHYRVPVYKTLASHPCIDLTLIHGETPVKSEISVLTNVDKSMPFRVVQGKINKLNFFGKELLWHKPSINLLKSERYDVVIHQFETKFASIWRTYTIQRARGGKFILWGIGASLQPTPLTDRVRCFLARRADAVVFYAEANRKRFIKMGLPSRKMFIARNSIDLTPIDLAVSKWPIDKLNDFRREKNLQDTHVILTVGALVERKKLEVLLQSTKQLLLEHPRIKLIIIGDGPQKKSLQKNTELLGIRKYVDFLGKITEEEKLAPWFLLSDMVVAPGQVGLLATQTHAYGRALVTCDNPEIQGPEIEILIPNRTGVLFQHNNATSLTEVMGSLLLNSKRRLMLGDAARVRAHEEYGIPNMVDGFLQAISYVTGRPLQMFSTDAVVDARR